MRDAHGELIAKLVYTSCVRADAIDGSQRYWSRDPFPSKASADWPLDTDRMVKSSLGMLLGGRAKDSIMGITRI